MQGIKKYNDKKNGGVKMFRFWVNLSSALLLLSIPIVHAERSKDGQVWVEAIVDVSEPYVQQTLIYTLRITSTAQVKTLTPTVPMLPGVALLEKLDQQPHFYTSQLQGVTYSISEFRYALTPLTFGQSQIMPASVDVTYSSTSSWNGYNYPYASNQQQKKINLKTNAVNLNVKPPASSSQGNWLPLQALALDGKLDKAPKLSIGEPFTVTLTTNALGITGTRLPEPQLSIKPSDFKVYSDRPQFGQRLVRNDSVLQGWRIDTYTLIPKRTGTLQIPEVQMHWWSLHEANSAWAKSPVHIIPVLDFNQTSISGQENAKNNRAEHEHISKTSSNTDNTQMSWFWWLFSNLGILALGWWLGAGRPGKEILYAFILQVRHESHRQGTKLAQRLSAYIRHLPWLATYREKLKAWYAMPKPWYKLTKNASKLVHAESTVLITEPVEPSNLHRQSWWRSLLKRMIPAPLRALQLLRAIDSEVEPLRLSRLIQQFAHEQFKSPLNTPLLRLSQYFSERYPHIDTVALKRLLKKLDQLHYDRPNQFRLHEWKAEFQHVLKYLPLYRAKLREPTQKQYLPALNPQAKPPC